MIAIGIYNTLEILRQTKVGLFLGDGDQDILLPNKYVPARFEIGDQIRVFVYLDHEERPVATTLEPYVTLGEFGFLRVNHINKSGAFLDWGLEKDIFVPYGEQAKPMEQGKRYLVKVYLDEKTNRLVASSKTDHFLNNDPLFVEEGDAVDLIFSHATPLGLNVIVNGIHKGMLYREEVFSDDLRIGDHLKGFVKKIRPGHKLDIALQQQGYAAVEPGVDKILKVLQSGGGFLRLTDASSPEDIRAILQMSKKTFKKAVGALYKQQQVVLERDGIRLKS